MSPNEQTAQIRESRRLSDSRRMVVKIGSILLADEATGEIRHAWLEALADDVAAMHAAGRQVVLVSSGAVAVGKRFLDIGARPLRLEEKQAAAATGQARLVHAYQESLRRHGINVAQVLLSIGDTEERRRHLNARSTLETLLKLGIVPVINENDTVATEEIRFGDNDRLAARVAQMVSADTLVLLSDIDGLYTADPRKHADATLVPEVREITPEIEAMAGRPQPGYGSGGMVTKLTAARIALSAGCRMVIADGKHPHALGRVDEGGGGTWFLPSTTPRSAHKRWIASTINPAGAIVVDAGAEAALMKGNSLLPAGVTGVDGDFQRGDAVVVKNAAGREVARGLCAYSAADARRIMGHKSRDIERLLGYRGREEMIHRDDLVLSPPRRAGTEG